MTRTQSGTHDFESSPLEALEIRCSRIFFPEAGATIDTVYINGGQENVLSQFSNTSVIKAGSLWTAKDGEYFSYVSGSAGQINYEEA